MWANACRGDGALVAGYRVVARHGVGGGSHFRFYPLAFLGLWLDEIRSGDEAGIFDEEMN